MPGSFALRNLLLDALQTARFGDLFTISIDLPTAITSASASPDPAPASLLVIPTPASAGHTMLPPAVVSRWGAGPPPAVSVPSFPALVAPGAPGVPTPLLVAYALAHGG